MRANADSSLLRRAASAGVLAAAILATASCATTPPDPGIAKRLTEVRAVAGAPVMSFRFSAMSSFEPIGLDNLLVFTSPRSAWLLRLDGSCRNIDFDPFLRITSTIGRVSSGFDTVIARDNPIPCRIMEIRPVDVAVLRRVDRERRVQGSMDVGTEQAKPVTVP